MIDQILIGHNREVEVTNNISNLLITSDYNVTFRHQYIFHLIYVHPVIL